VKTKSSLLLAAIVSGSVMVFTGCNARPKAPDDAQIVASVQSQLYQNPELKPLDVHVASDHGVVTLTGEVHSPLEKLAVEDLAQKAPGTKQVIDQLAVTASDATVASAPAVAPNTPSAAEHTAARPERTERLARHPRSRQQAQDEAATAMDGQRASSQDQEPSDGESGSSPAAPAPASDQAPAPLPAPPPPKVIFNIPAGTVVSVRMIDPITSQTAQPGQEFAAVVYAPVAVGNHVVIPQGAEAKVRLVEVHNAGHYRGQSELKVELTSISLNGKTYNVESGNYVKTGNSRGKNSAEKIGGGAGLGALIGGLIGHGAGAAIGAGVGAASGTIAQGASRGQQVTIPSEAKIDFVLKSPLSITESQKAESANQADPGQ
jgi:hypothetical protein